MSFVPVTRAEFSRCVRTPLIEHHKLELIRVGLRARKGVIRGQLPTFGKIPPCGKHESAVVSTPRTVEEKNLSRQVGKRIVGTCLREVDTGGSKRSTQTDWVVVDAIVQIPQDLNCSCKRHPVRGPGRRAARRHQVDGRSQCCPDRIWRPACQAM